MLLLSRREEDRRERMVLLAFVAATGQPVDTTALAAGLGQAHLWDLRALWGGAVWTLAYEPKGDLSLYQIAAAGTSTLVAGATNLPWNGQQFRMQPQTVAAVAPGTVWMAHDYTGVARLRDGKLQQFRYDRDGSPAVCQALAISRAGVVYAGGPVLYAYNLGTSLTGAPRPEPRPSVELGEPVWVYRSKDTYIGQAWPVADLVLHNPGGPMLTALGASDGRLRYTVSLREEGTNLAYMVPGPGATQFTVALPDRLQTHTAADGQLLQTVLGQRDHHVSPLPLGEDFMVVPATGGQTLVRWGPAGQARWTRPLDGYPLRPPVVCGPLLLLQIRARGGHRPGTVALNGDSGDVVWRDVTDADGAGLVVDDGGTTCFETASFGTPTTIEAWVVARQTRTGAVRWHYRHPGTTAAHAPVFDPAGERLYVALADGTVLCLESVGGTRCWQTTLPASPRPADPDRYAPYANSVLLAPGVVCVVDCLRELHVLAADTGKVLARFGLAPHREWQGVWLGRERLQVTPWFSGDLLVVPRQKSIAAYRLPPAVRAPPRAPGAGP